MRTKTRDVALVALFTALVAAGAFIRIPTLIMPITLQGAFCMLAGLLLGRKRGALAVFIYVVMGLIGIPVFTEGGGIFYALKPSFGYLIGMIIGTYLCGLLSHGKDGKTPWWRMLVGAVAEMLSVDIIGVIYMYLILNFYLGTPTTFLHTLYIGVVVFLPTDVIWCLLTSLLAYKLTPILKKSTGHGEI